MIFDERERTELACRCGCDKRWALSRGDLGGAEVIAIAMRHRGERVGWIAMSFDDGWACVRSALADANVAASVVDPADSPFPALGLPGVWLPRARIVANAARKTKVFARHDALLSTHPDLRHLFTDHGRDYSFAMPDCVFALPPAERSRRNSENFAECGDRLFVRALLPIPVNDGGELRIGVWNEVSSEQFFALMRVFWDDPAEYMRQRLDGQTESSLPLAGHDVRGARLTLAARVPDQCLFVTTASQEWLATLLRDGVSIAKLPELVREIEGFIARRSGRPQA